MKRLTFALVLFTTLGATGQGLAAGGDASLLTLKRIISDDEFRTERFGPARWLEDG
jgi:hypothetical protein